MGPIVAQIRDNGNRCTFNQMKTPLRQMDWLPAWVRRDRQSETLDPEVSRLRKASILAGGIQPPARRDPRLAEEMPEPPPLSANTPTSPAASRPYGARPTAAGGGMRLQPVSDFSWGGAAKGLGSAATPRVCADHLLIWLGTGSLRIELPRQHRMQRAGDLAFVPAGTAFSLWHGPGAEGDVVNIPTAMIRRTGVALPQTLTLGRPVETDAEILQRAIPQLTLIGQPKDAAARRAAGAQLSVIGSALTRLRAEETPRVHPKDDPRTARPLSDRYVALVRRDMGRGLTIADFAHGLGVTAATLDRACRCCRGRSALELLYDLRLERAVALLREGRLTSVEIAAETGYVSLSHMNRAFMAATGRGVDYFRHDFD